jgi:hypothetical protein
MKLYRGATSVVAAVMSAIAIALIQPQTLAFAGSASSANTLSVQSGTVRVSANSVNTANTSGVQLSTSVTNGTKTFWVHNYGTLEVSTLTMTIGLPGNSNISSFRRCAVNVNFSGPNACVTGGATNLTITKGTPTAFALPLPAGSFYSFQLGQNRTATMTVSISVSLSNYSAKIVTS